MPDGYDDQFGTGSQRPMGGAADASATRGAAPELAPGTVWRERYRIERLLATSALCSVYLAQDMVLGRDVVVKVLRPVAGADRAYQRFFHEAQLVSRLDHPGIVKVLEFAAIDDPTPYIVMEYVAGETLANFIQRMTILEEEMFLDITFQICAALGHAHSHQVLHKDLKPANILVSIADDGLVSVKVSDFGIAKLVDSSQTLNGATNVFGTPAYMSPEQCEAHGSDMRSDIYSFGCIMYEMLAGVPPFAGTTDAETMRMHLSEQPFQLTLARDDLQHGDSLERIILRALEKTPEYRYETIDGLQEDLLSLNRPRNAAPVSRPGTRESMEITRVLHPEKTAGGRMKQRQTASRFEGSSTSNRKKDILVIAGLACFAVLAGGLGIYFGMKQNEPSPDLIREPEPAVTTTSTSTPPRLMTNVPVDGMPPGMVSAGTLLRSQGEIQAKWDDTMRDAQIRMDDGDYKPAKEKLDEALELASQQQGLPGRNNKIVTLNTLVDLNLAMGNNAAANKLATESYNSGYKDSSFTGDRMRVILAHLKLDEKGIKAHTLKEEDVYKTLQLCREANQIVSPYLTPGSNLAFELMQHNANMLRTIPHNNRDLVNANFLLARWAEKCGKVAEARAAYGETAQLIDIAFGDKPDSSMLMMTALTARYYADHAEPAKAVVLARKLSDFIAATPTNNVTDPEQQIGLAWSYLGQAYGNMAEKNYGAAEDSLRNAKKHFDRQRQLVPTGPGQCEMAMARNLLLQHKDHQARNKLLDALQIAEQLHDSATIVDLLTMLSQVNDGSVEYRLYSGSHLKRAKSIQAREQLLAQSQNIADPTE